MRLCFSYLVFVLNSFDLSDKMSDNEAHTRLTSLLSSHYLNETLISCFGSGFSGHCFPFIFTPAAETSPVLYLKKTSFVEPMSGLNYVLCRRYETRLQNWTT